MITPDRIIKLGHGFRAAKTLLSAVELDVFTALADGSLDAETLLAKLDIASRGARDFFDALVALGMLERGEDGRYENSVEADFYLDRCKPSYIGGELEHFGDYVYPHWSRLTEALRTGEPQSGARATEDYPALYRDAARLAGFAKGMTGGNLPVAAALAREFPWREYRSFVDIGTAQGALPVVIARAFPHLGGIGFDLPPMKPVFESYVREHGLADRVKFIAGDFLQNELPAADVLIFGRVLHNWDLATKKLLLSKAYRALPSAVR